ncbi:MAG: hypothetical protein ABSG68_16880 [Thermoguttaceae bacterium]|jgi:hypothetical protein
MDLFKREDWTLFRNLSTLGQRAGVTQEVLPALVLKELVDNALDAAGQCGYGRTEDGGLFVEDEGDGLPGTDAEIAALFSVARPLSSSKLLRLPTRGALGNGLRVVVGAVLASGGELTVKTCGRALRLRPCDADGSTTVEHVEPWKGQGTRIEALLGEALPVDDSTFQWAQQAEAMATIDGQSYRGATSPWWYDSDSFYELTQAAGAWPVRALVESFAGCSGARAGKLAADFAGRPCDSLGREEAEMLLAAMRGVSREVNAKRLGAVGLQYQPAAGYAREAATFQVKPARGTMPAVVPVVVEAWASPADRPSIVFYVNRTPITAEINVSRCMDDKAAYGLVGCGLSSEHRNTACPVKAGRGREFSIVVNVTTPHMPITTDGKAPDLSVIERAIRAAIEKAIRGAKRKNANGNGRQGTQTAIITNALPTAIEKASGDGQYRYSLRQLFYAVRPYVLNALADEPAYNYFSRVVADYERNQGGDLPGMYRDDRGTLYHPHTGETIPLGTRSVEAYQRPAWTFNKILYCEKEGFFPILIDAQWPERHDCALLTSKGYASRAARDVLDLLGDTDEPLTFYCLHDADGPGTMIYQTLQKGTRARPGRRVEIVNLGLDPDEAAEMDLPVETVAKKGRSVPVASYILPTWRKWLQRNRVELNAMDTPRFLEWLDGKMERASGKLIPPPPVVADRLRDETRAVIRQALVDKALLSARIEDRTAEALDKLGVQLREAQTKLLAGIGKELTAHPSQPWTGPVVVAAKKVAAKWCQCCQAV